MFATKGVSFRSVGTSSKPQYNFKSTRITQQVRNYVSLSEPLDTFPRRHLGSSDKKIKSLLDHFKFNTLDEFSQSVIPQIIRRQQPFVIPGDEQPIGESGALEQLRNIMNENKVYRSYLGTGFSNTLTPSVLLRNMVENPLWYTPYTPYQAEISQGRLESLLNFQTMIADLTGMEYSNASLLDGATACAEAMAFAFKNATNNSNLFFVDQNCHPQDILVTVTRAEPIGIEVVVGDPATYDFSTKKFCGGIVQYQSTDGQINTHSRFVEEMKKQSAFSIFSTDLLALTLTKSPGELGADIVIGNSQRFGVPLGYGGPHAAFFAIKNAKLVRKLPGRVVGVSVDQYGKPTLRLTMQTREQHIKREKATSNICTAQALLANLASMYAIYHGPQGLKDIAERIHLLTVTLANGLKKLGHNVVTTSFFDTITVQPSGTTAEQVIERAESLFQINLRKIDSKVSISLDETTKLSDVVDVLKVFSKESNDFVSSPFSINDLANSARSLFTGTELERTSQILTHPVFNKYHQEHEMLRYLNKLVRKDISLAISMIPLGSCTMKLNATSEMIPITWPTVNQIHPFAPHHQAKGYQKLFSELEQMICQATGFKGVSFQPNAGSAGEYTGLRVIRAYLKNKGESHRNVVLIPSSAHGTNPASAAMSGFKIVVVDCEPSGYIDMNSLRSKVEANKDNLAAIMVTYPSTFGIFEESIKEVCDLIHKNGGQVYLDGANLNALVGLVSLAEIGADVCHLNLHKTFCIPHGGGGPGMGPIGVQSHLIPFLPAHPFASYKYDNSIGPISGAPWGSSSILPITWMYIKMMGSKGLTQATQLAILNANYIRTRLADHYLVKFTSATGWTAHEVIIDIRPLKEAVEAEDVAKRLMDYNFHAPTMSWPVPGTLMIEPTESESKDELDRFCDALIAIRNEIQDVLDGKQPKANSVLKNAPHTAEIVCSDNWDRPYSRDVAAFPLAYVRENKFWPTSSRVNNVYGDTHIQCACPPVDSYTE